MRVTLRPLGPLVPILLGCLVTFHPGCADPSEAAKTSLFEHDHEVPTHWPSGLAELSANLRERLGSINEAEQPVAQQELADLIRWTPEITADTYISEETWLPIHHLCETIERDLSAGKIAAERVRQQINSLCELIDQADASLQQDTALLAEESQ